jgi:MarR-like DNA-binding transcriptional regulator SgrR of sgrS sRNA
VLDVSGSDGKIPLTKSQLKLYLLLRKSLEQGYSPTYEELAQLYGCVKSNICILLQKIRAKGWVNYVSASKGGIKLL